MPDPPKKKTTKKKASSGKKVEGEADADDLKGKFESKDEEMDPEYNEEDKNMKKKKDDMVSISRTELKAMKDKLKKVDDFMPRLELMEKTYKTRQDDFDQKELAKLNEDFADPNASYILSDDFKKGADLAAMQFISKALVKYEPPIDAQNMLFTSASKGTSDDFATQVEQAKAQAAQMFGLGGKK